jgi:selT/selW/selH-like putative selenoprotein
LAAELRKEFPDVEIQMIPSGGGRFEVGIDGDPVFQKSKLGRHAKAGEVASLIRERVLRA